MQSRPANMDEVAKRPFLGHIQIIVLITLLAVIASVLFASGNQQDRPEKTKTIFSGDAAGSSVGGQVVCRSREWIRETQTVLRNEGMIDGAGAPLPHVQWLFWDNIELARDYLFWYNDPPFGLGGKSGNGTCQDRPDDPPITLDPDCVAPTINVALLIDRSSSVVEDGAPTTERKFKESLYTLVNAFYDRFTPNPRNGKVNFILYAFGTKSVLQNKTTNGNEPVLASNVITDASDPTSRDAMLDAISQIHFRDESSPQFNDKNWPNSDRNGFQHRDGSSYQRQRAYNKGSERNPGDYSKTNWHDALTSVMKAGSLPFYNNPGPSGIGKRIDLAVMVTDGLPTADNGEDWTWQAGDFKGADRISYDPGVDLTNATAVRNYNNLYEPDRQLHDLYKISTKDEGRNLAKSAVDKLRSGNAARGGIGSRPPISVKGIIINTNNSVQATNEAKYAAKEVFGEGNYFYATDFTATLKKQIEDLVFDVIDKSNCDYNQPVTPKLLVEVKTPDGSNSVSPVEGSEGELVQVRVTNLTNGTLNDVKLCVTNSLAILDGKDNECSVLADIGTMKEGEVSVWFTYRIEVALGESIENVRFVAIGRSPASDESLAQGNGTRFPQSEVAVPVNERRVSLPS